MLPGRKLRLRVGKGLPRSHGARCQSWGRKLGCSPPAAFSFAPNGEWRSSEPASADVSSLPASCPPAAPPRQLSRRCALSTGRRGSETRRATSPAFQAEGPALSPTSPVGRIGPSQVLVLRCCASTHLSLCPGCHSVSGPHNSLGRLLLAHYVSNEFPVCLPSKTLSSVKSEAVIVSCLPKTQQ